MKRNHPWHQAATYIRAAFVEETHPVAVATAEKAARYLERAVKHEPDRTNSEEEHEQERADQRGHGEKAPGAR